MSTIAFPNLECPPSMIEHIREIFNGEYDLPYSRNAPVIIDIGANIGGFAIWASQRWPKSIIHCYEPVAEVNFETLKRNLSHLDPRRVHANKFAIGDPQRKQMFLGKNNCGEGSFFDMGEQSSQTIGIETHGAGILPPAHILKIDAEILQHHPPMNYEVVLIEFHGENKRRQVDTILQDYCLIGAHVRHLHRGILKYVHRKIVPPDYARYEVF